MTSYYPSEHAAIAELAFALQRLGGVLPKRQLQQVATTIVARFYGLRQIRDTAYWWTRAYMRVYLAVRLDGKSRVWLPPVEEPNFGMIVAAVDEDGVLDEVYNGSTSSLLKALEERGNRTVTLTNLVERLAQLGLLGQIDHRAADAGWWGTFPEDSRTRVGPLPLTLRELREDHRRDGGPVDLDNNDGGPPPPDDFPPPPDGNGPARGVGGIQELLNHAVLLSADESFFDELFENL